MIASVSGVYYFETKRAQHFTLHREKMSSREFEMTDIVQHLFHENGHYIFVFRSDKDWGHSNEIQIVCSKSHSSLWFCKHIVVKEWYCKKERFLVCNSENSKNLNKPVDDPQSIIFSHFMSCNRIQSCKVAVWELYWTFNYSLICLIIVQVINYSLLKRPLLFGYFYLENGRNPRSFHSSYKNYLSFLCTLRSSLWLIFIGYYISRCLSLVRDMIPVEVLLIFLIRNLNKFILCNIRSSMRQKMMLCVNHSIETRFGQVINSSVLSSTAEIFIWRIREVILKISVILKSKILSGKVDFIIYFLSLVLLRSTIKFFSNLIVLLRLSLNSVDASLLEHRWISHLEKTRSTSIVRFFSELWTMRLIILLLFEDSLVLIVMDGTCSSLFLRRL